MQTFQNTVTIARPAGEVFAFLADLRNMLQQAKARLRGALAGGGARLTVAERTTRC